MARAGRPGAAAGLPAAVLATVLASCSSGTTTPATVEEAASSANRPVVLVSRPSDGSGMTALLSGVLTIAADGCVHVADALAVWPRHTTWQDGSLHLPDGTRIEPGQGVEGGGGVLPANLGRNALAPGQPAEQCTWTSEVLAFNDVEPIRTVG